MTRGNYTPPFRPSSDAIEKPRQMEFKITHLQRIKLFGEGDFGKPKGFANIPLLLN